MFEGSDCAGNMAKALKHFLLLFNICLIQILGWKGIESNFFWEGTLNIWMVFLGPRVQLPRCRVANVKSNWITYSITAEVPMNQITVISLCVLWRTWRDIIMPIYVTLGVGRRTILIYVVLGGIMNPLRGGIY